MRLQLIGLVYNMNGVFFQFSYVSHYHRKKKIETNFHVYDIQYKYNIFKK